MILPEAPHGGPVDSRGLSMGTAVLEHPEPAGLIQIAGKYLAAPDAPKAPCHVCGEEQPVAMTLAPPLKGQPYAICPRAHQDACLERGLKKLAAEHAQAEAEALPAVPERPALPAGRTRPSQARTLLGAARRKVAEASKSPAEPAVEETSAGSADPPGGDAA